MKNQNITGLNCSGRDWKAVQDGDEVSLTRSTPVHEVRGQLRRGGVERICAPKRCSAVLLTDHENVQPWNEALLFHAAIPTTSVMFIICS